MSNVKSYDDMRLFGVVERVLNDEFNVINLHRDSYEDQFDDAGYIVSISEKEEEYYLHIIFITYNLDVNNLILDDEDMGDLISSVKNRNYPDYIKFKTKEECQDYINYLVSKIVDLGEDYVYWDEEDNYLEGFSATECSFIRTISNSFFEDPEYEIKNLRGLSELEYIPNFERNIDDEDEYEE